MSRTFSTNSGSVESLNVSLRCGCRPNARQMRTTVVWLIPTAFASPRVLQCVAFGGVCSSVVATRALHVRIADRARRTDPRVVLQPRQTPGREARPPHAHGRPMHAERVGQHPVRHVRPVRAGEHDPGAQRERLRRAAPARPALERGMLLGREVDASRYDAASAHDAVQYGTHTPRALLTPKCRLTSGSHR